MNVPGALYHVMGRCLDQYKLFPEDSDREYFLACFSRYLQQSTAICYAWALMSNHYHLVFRLGSTELWEILKPLNMRYALYHKKRTKRRGPLFMDRFKSIATQDQDYAKELIRYVHLNPLRAGVVKNIEALDRYPWTGHAALMGNVKRNFQDTQAVLKRFGSSTAVARINYRGYILEGVKTHDVADRIVELVRRSNSGSEAGRKSDCWVIGDRNFVQNAIAAATRRQLRVNRFELEGRSFGTILNLIEKKFQITEDTIRIRHRGGAGSDARKVFAWLAVKIYRAPIAEVALFLDTGFSAVSAMARAGRVIAKEHRISI